MLFQTTSLGLYLLTIAISSDPTSNGQEPGDVGRILISRTNLRSRQYCQRIDRLRSLGLIYRKKGRYSLSSLGRVVYETQKIIEIAIHDRWRLAAVDSLESLLSPNGIPVEDRIKITNSLLGKLYFYPPKAAVASNTKTLFYMSVLRI